MNSPGFIDVAIALVLVAVAPGITRVWKIPIQKQMSIGVVRSFVQLTAVGFALERIFDMQSLWLIALAIVVMLTIGARQAGMNVGNLPNRFWICLSSMTLGSLFTLGLMLATGLITTEARYVIPLAGMLISNSMNAATLTMKSICENLSDNRAAVESSLALGKTWREASRKYQRRAITGGIVWIMNFMKTAGIVALPGAMTGMILAGADPLEAVLLQIIVGYMLLSAMTVTSVVSLEISIRLFFNEHHQFRLPEGI
ncbi:MAG: iron export ABC transporter permease subunit FetB [candidate division Zixibacteria bacterium]